MVVKIAKMMLPDFELIRDVVYRCCCCCCCCCCCISCDAVFSFFNGWIYGWRTLLHPVKLITSMMVMHACMNTRAHTHALVYYAYVCMQ